MKKVLILTYYWPPSGGSGVQRWMYFAKHLPQYGFEPIVVTVAPESASYKFIDHSFEQKVAGIRVYRTKSREPFSAYSAVIGKPRHEAIPQGFSGEGNPGVVQKFSRFVRGNFFIPDARRGWIPYAVKQAAALIEKEEIKILITTGPPHSTHLAGLRLKRKFSLRWIADFRDPWAELYYNSQLYRTAMARRADAAMEMDVLRNADNVLTVGPSLMQVLQQKAGAGSAPGKFQYIYNGFDAEVFRNLEKQRQPVFTICHLGVLSDNQPLGSFTRSLQAVAGEGEKIRLRLVGKVSPNILEQVRKESPAVQLETSDYLPHSEAMQEALNSDLLLNSLAETGNGKYLISGKLMEYIATGNPILCLGDPAGDAASLLSEFPGARVFARNDENGMVSFLRSVLEKHKSGSDHGKNLVEKYSRYATAGQLAALLNQ